MNRPAHLPRRVGLALGLVLGAAVLCGQGVAGAAPADESSGRNARSGTDHHRRSDAVSPTGTPRATGSDDAAGSRRQPSAVTKPRPQPLAARSPDPESPTQAESSASETAITVALPSMPVSAGQSFSVSPDAIAERAAGYVAAGGDPADAPRFFFGDLAVSSLDTLATQRIGREQVRTQLGNLAASGYFGGIWLRDNLRDESADPGAAAGATAGTDGLSVSAVGIRLFDALAAGLTGLATTPLPGVGTSAARASVPVLLALYGYNKGYLEFLLENPPAGVASMRDTLSCTGFLGCTSTTFPLEIATRYDGVLDLLDHPTTLAWQEMAAWTGVAESATGTGRFVWSMIAQAGAFSPDSYDALVDLSSAYLMISKAAALAGMRSYADSDADLAAGALLMQAGLWMWSGAYFAGLASGAARGTVPSIVVPSIVVPSMVVPSMVISSA